MKIAYGKYPPNYEKIAEVFNIKGKTNAVFTYGDTLYVPDPKLLIDPPLLKHEQTHVRQQKAMGVEAWWEEYFKNARFRLDQELEAYREQYRAMASWPLKGRLGYLEHCAGDLSGEMYGNMLTLDEAREAITQGIILKPTQRAGVKQYNLRKAKKRERQNRKKGRK